MSLAILLFLLCTSVCWSKMWREYRTYNDSAEYTDNSTEMAWSKYGHTTTVPLDGKAACIILASSLKVACRSHTVRCCLLSLRTGPLFCFGGWEGNKKHCAIRCSFLGWRFGVVQLNCVTCPDLSRIRLS